MKKSIFLILFVFGCGTELSFAGRVDSYGSERPALWRSSRTAVAENFVLLSSSPFRVILHDVFVSTPSAGIGRITIYDSTASVPSIANTTFTIIDNTTIGRKGPFDVVLSSGLVVDKVGTAEILILWDYFQNLNQPRDNP